MCSFEIACTVDKGVHHEKNDDRAMVNGTIINESSYEGINENNVLAIVCDGVGGENFGNEAAEIVTQVFADAKITVRKDIEDTLKLANEKVKEKQKADFMHGQMSTTIAGVYLDKEDAIVFNIGDSSVFRYRSPYMSKLSEDHTLIAELKSLGLPHKRRDEHCITRCLGSDSAIPTIYETFVFERDILLICSDGITDGMDIDTLEDMFLENENQALSVVCEKLINTAVKNGTTDNMSVILIRKVNSHDEPN